MQGWNLGQVNDWKGAAVSSCFLCCAVCRLPARARKPRRENLPAHRAALLREPDTAALILNPVKQNLATTINQNYVVQNQTSMIVWTGPPASSHISCSFSTIYDCVELLTASIGLPVIYAWYSIFPFAHPDGITVGGMGQ